MFAKGRYIGWLLGALCLIGQGCSSGAVQEAEHVVAQADSLRTQGGMYGIDEGDSARLAQAYETLQKKSQLSIINRHFSPSYARACYHYGRLLREKDNPVAAMQVFINATHSRTRDYAILGRIYSNMGDIAHLAGEFDLSYNMYERSGEMYLLAKDTLLYYYDLNNMAYELAEQGKKDSCFAIAENIKSRYLTDSTLIAYCLMSQAQACLKCEQYDSVLLYAGLSKRYLQSVPSVTLQLAQAYSLLGVKDSAVLYAEQVFVTSNALSDINNALYILANDDRTEDIEVVRRTGAERSDTQKLLEIRQGKVSQAVQLLQQNLMIKTDWRWLYAIIGTLLVVGIIIIVYVHRKRRKKNLLVQRIEILNDINNAAEQQHRQIVQEHTNYKNTLTAQIERNCVILSKSSNIKEELCWNNYDKMCAIVNLRLYGIIDQLRTYSLTEKEVRLCVLILLQVGTKQMVDMIPYSQSGLGKFKYSTARKLGTTTINIRSFLLNLMG